jgi:hypothetical protein
MAGRAASCSFLFRMAGLAASCSFLFRMAERETNQRERATGCISEAKNRMIFPKTGKRASLERARFFTGKSSDFLHASPKRPELYPVIILFF